MYTKKLMVHAASASRFFVGRAFASYGIACCVALFRVRSANRAVAYCLVKCYIFMRLPFILPSVVNLS